MEVRTLEHKDIEKDVAPEEVVSVNFIEAIINKDNETGKYGGRVLTRFPPEPNGYLHIGHAKSICLNFGIGKQYNGLTNLRFDDTNPVKEDVEYVNSIMEDVKWLGFDWNEQPRYASDYFDQMYEYAKKLITLGKAYVDDQTADEIKQNRGDFSTPGVNSSYRERSVEENLALFEEMKAGKYKDGEKVLRAKIDMAHPNIVMRDPVIYRIVNTEHHNTGNEWKIYPMYDFAHPIEDAIERITHSICTLEFEVHRPLYDWVLEEWDDTEIPQQIEFARLNVTKMVMSKRKLRALVEAGLVSGWDDPRMPTISGLRRRGYTPESIRDFCERIGVAKADSVVDIALLEFCIREDLKLKAKRPMVVVDPVKVIITNYPEGKTELCTVENNPENEELGNREVVFGREIYIERSDFMEEPVKKFFRLAPGKEVRLKGAYFITCTDVIKDENGNITEIHCTYDPETKSGSGCTRKVKGTLHWVEASTAVDIESRLYDYLLKEDSDGKDFLGDFNHESLQVFKSKGEACLATTVPGDHFQFLRQGYFVTDKDSTSDHIVVNRIVGLRDSWAKAQKNSITHYINAFMRRKMKKIVLLATVAAVLVSMPAMGSAANIKSILNRSQTVTYQGVKLPEGVTMYQNNPKALFAGEGKKDIKSVLLEAGASSADVYTLNIKNENEMQYAVYANVVLGKQLSSRMSEAKHMNTDSSSLGALAAAINNGDSPVLGTFTVINPLAKQGNAYKGTLKYKSIANNNSYNEILHISISEDKYTGPNAHLIAVDEANDSVVFPKVKGLLHTK